MKFWLALFALMLLTSTSGAASRIRSVATPHGTLYYPNDGQASHPGILVLHGSEGGGRAFNHLDAQMFAAHGFAALAHCYFQCLNEFADIADPKVELIDVDITKTYQAMEWLRQSTQTRGHKIGVYGVSRGAELTFLMATLTIGNGLVAPDAIAAHAVTDVIVEGFSWNWMSHRCYLGSEMNWNEKCGTAPPPAGTPNPYRAWKWQGSTELVQPGQRISIENFRGPIFFSHGTADELWDVQKAYRVRDTLIRAKKQAEVHIYEGQGHALTGVAAQEKLDLLLNFFERALR